MTKFFILINVILSIVIVILQATVGTTRREIYFFMDSLFADYDNLLINYTDSLDLSCFYSAQAGGVNQKIAISCIRYALVDILLWDYGVAKFKFDNYIIRKMKLEKLISFIKFPPEVPSNSIDYILSLVFPSEHSLSRYQVVKNTYISILENPEIQFPRNYFAGTDGFNRFCICLKYIIERLHPVNSLDELYRFFTFGSWKSFLLRNRLKVPVENYAINIYDALFSITKDMPEARFYYFYYSFVADYYGLREKKKKQKNLVYKKEK